MTFQTANSNRSILAKRLRKYLLIGTLCLLAAPGIISVSPRVSAQERPAGAPTAPQPATKMEATSHHGIEDASREELLKIIDKQRKLIKALEARVEELEQSAKSEAQEPNKQ